MREGSLSKQQRQTYRAAVTAHPEHRAAVLALGKRYVAELTVPELKVVGERLGIPFPRPEPPPAPPQKHLISPKRTVEEILADPEVAKNALITIVDVMPGLVEKLWAHVLDLRATLHAVRDDPHAHHSEEVWRQINEVLRLP